jgi:glycosyltransferase involved in cell wall biosynthesis
MKVFFHSNGALLDSPYFNYTWKYSPKGVIYISNKHGVGDILIDMNLQRRLKAFIGIGKILLNLIGKSVVKVSDIPEEIGKVDLIHSLNTIPMTKLPHIVEIESYHSLFVGGSMDKHSIDRIHQLLLKENCKKVLFWTQNAYDNFNALMPDDKLKSKSQILYPAVPLNKQNKFHKKPTIGFIARDFFSKGGELVLPVMKDFVKAKRANAIIVTDVDLIREKNEETYRLYSHHINFQKLMPRDELYKKVFPKIDILFYPGFSDSYGFIFPEAASFGIPVITMNGVARTELVHINESGYVVSKKLQKNGFPIGIDEQEKENIMFNFHMVLTNLVSNKKLRKKMSDYNYNLAKNGIFSIKKRNTKLLKIYKEAIQ